MKLFVLKHCTTSLINAVFNQNDSEFENICINDLWDIDEYIKKDDNTISFDAIKVMFVFDKGGCTLRYQGKRINYSTLIKEMGGIQTDSISSFWLNNIANGVTPKFDVGEIVVPEVLPIYSHIQNEQGQWTIGVLNEGKYTPRAREGVFNSMEDAKERAHYLNMDIYTKS